MIKRIEIRNFQAHRRLAVDFSNGVTSITGPSDIGKSAIIRAIQWAVFNKPGGLAFLRSGAKRCSVKLFLDSGDTIYREKGKANIYKINDTELKAFGNDPPAEIVSLLNLNDINFQSQHDAPYWFSETAGECARQMNRLIDLEIIDRAISNIGAVIRKAKSRTEFLEEEREEIRTALEALEFAPEMDAELSAVESANETLKEHCAKRAQLAETIQSAISANEKAETQRQAAQIANLAVRKGNTWADISAKLGRLRAGIKIIMESVTISKRLPPAPVLERLGVLQAGVNEYQHRRARLAGALGNYERAKEDAWRANEQAEKAKEELMGIPVCPACGRPVE